MEAQPLPRVLEPAASTVADSTTFAPVGRSIVTDPTAVAVADADHQTSPQTRNI